MFLKLTDNETQGDLYLNPDHIVRFVPNNAGEGTIIFMATDATVGGDGQVFSVHENAEEVFRMISRQEKPQKAGSTGGRGLI